jgi:excisionase family DNA binding protein
LPLILRKEVAGEQRMNNDVVTVTEAAELLGTSKEKVARLVRQGVLTARRSTLDARRRLIPRTEIEELLRAEGHAPASEEMRSPDQPPDRKRPRTAGMYTGPVVVPARDVEEYLEEHWRPS